MVGRGGGVQDGVGGINAVQFHSLNSAFFRVSCEFSPNTLGSCAGSGTGGIKENTASSPSHLLHRNSFSLLQLSNTSSAAPPSAADPS